METLCTNQGKYRDYMTLRLNVEKHLEEIKKPNKDIKVFQTSSYAEETTTEEKLVTETNEMPINESSEKIMQMSATTHDEYMTQEAVEFELNGEIPNCYVLTKFPNTGTNGIKPKAKATNRPGMKQASKDIASRMLRDFPNGPQKTQKTTLEKTKISHF